MSEPFLGEIMMFGGNFAIRGWAMCNGQLLSIAQNTALFSILGTTFGGDGRTTFALPDLRGRAPINWGQSPGLSNYVIGQVAGVESTTLLATQMPAHTHAVNASSNLADAANPSGNIWAAIADSTGAAGLGYTAPAGANAPMAPQAIGIAGGSQPFSIMQPFLCVTFLIALEGIFPSRN